MDSNLEEWNQKQSELSERNKDMEKAGIEGTHLGYVITFVIWMAVAVKEFADGYPNEGFACICICLLVASLMVIVRCLSKKATCVADGINSKYERRQKKKAHDTVLPSKQEYIRQDWNLEKMIGVLTKHSCMSVFLLTFDMCIGFILCLSLWAFFAVNEPVYRMRNFCISVVCFVIMAVVHLLWSKIFKKKKFKKFLIKNTNEKCGIIIHDSECFFKALSDDIQNRLLYRSKEWIITDNFIVGKSSMRMGCMHVAVPRSLIDKIILSKSEMDTVQQSVTMATLTLLLKNGKRVMIITGAATKIDLTYKVLEHTNVNFLTCGQITYEE